MLSPNFDSQSRAEEHPGDGRSRLQPERRVSSRGDVVRRTLTKYGVCAVWGSGCPRHWQLEPGRGRQVDPSQTSRRRTDQEGRKAGSRKRCGQVRTALPNSGRRGEKGSRPESGRQSVRQGVLHMLRQRQQRPARDAVRITLANSERLAEPRLGSLRH